LVQSDLLQALDARSRDSTVGEAMQVTFETADLLEMTETVFRRLQECACHTLPVLPGGRLAGLVTMDNVGEFMSIRAVLEK
jgi:hypothetical protein